MRSVRVQDHAANAGADFCDDERGQGAGQRHPRRQDGVSFDGVAEGTHRKIGQKTVEGLENDKERENKSSVRHVDILCNRRACSRRRGIPNNYQDSA